MCIFFLNKYHESFTLSNISICISGRYEDVEVDSFSQTNGPEASIRMKLNGLFPSYYSNMNVRGIPQLQNPLNSFMCWSLKNKDIIFT